MKVEKENVIVERSVLRSNTGVESVEYSFYFPGEQHLEHLTDVPENSARQVYELLGTFFGEVKRKEKGE